MKKERRRYLESCEVSRLVRYELGGVEQKVTLEGRRADAPVVIFLHGGPGSPLPVSVGTRGMFPDLADRYVLAAWDQLGCGANRCRLGDDACIDRYVDMTLDLVRAVRRDFPSNEVNLLGVSWGSILAARAAAREPGLVDHVVTYGQVLKQLGFNDEVFEALERSAMPEKLKGELRAIRGSGARNLESGMRLAGWVRKYTEGYQAQGDGMMPVGAFVRGMLESPDYTLRDLVAAVSNDFSKASACSRRSSPSTSPTSSRTCACRTSSCRERRTSSRPPVPSARSSRNAATPTCATPRPRAAGTCPARPA